MKIIDLLNKIANGKEVPKRIRYEDEIYYLSDNNETYIGTISHSAIGRRHCLEQCLTDEVEILEEKKIPEKIEICKITDETISGLKKSINVLNEDVANKINDIIDYLKSKGE